MSLPYEPPLGPPKPCERCGGSGKIPVRTDGTSAVLPWLRTGVCEGFVDDPPSEGIADLLNAIERVILRAGGRLAQKTERSGMVCPHGLSPCISTCGVEHTIDGWRPIPKAARLEWYAHVYALNPQRRNMHGGGR